jgi:hypothetical protein
VVLGEVNETEEDTAVEFFVWLWVRVLFQIPVGRAAPLPVPIELPVGKIPEVTRAPVDVVKPEETLVEFCVWPWVRVLLRYPVGRAVPLPVPIAPPVGKIPKGTPALIDVFG